MPKIFTYSKEEKLKSRKLLEQLFKNGKNFNLFPVKVFYMHGDERSDFPVKAGVGAGARNFKKAVDRNRIKRLLREAYRTEKNILHEYLEQQNMQVIFFLLYVDKVMPGYAEIKNKMPLILARLIKELNENIPANT